MAVTAERPLIRGAQPSDAVRLTDIERLVAFSPWSLSQFISACRSDRDQVRVACDDEGRAVGFAIFSEVLGEASLLNIAVHPEWQRQGVGLLLLEAVLDELRRGGAQRIVLEVRASNASAIALYRRLGFDNDGLRKKYYPAAEGREDAVLMSLELADRK